MKDIAIRFSIGFVIGYSVMWVIAKLIELF